VDMGIGGGRARWGGLGGRQERRGGLVVGPRQWGSLIEFVAARVERVEVS